MNRLPLTILAFLIAFSSLVHAQDSVSKHVRQSIHQTVLRQKFPAIPSIESNFSYEDIEEPSTLKPVLDRLNRAIFPAGQGFQVKWSEVLNVLSDSQRKLILMDVLILAVFVDGSTDNELRFASLFAHEISHYLYKLHKLSTQQDVIPGELLTAIEIPESTHEHASIEALACELMRRAGYSRWQIEQGFLQLHAFTEKLTDMNDTKSVGYLDLAARRRIVSQWLAEQK